MWPVPLTVTRIRRSAAWRTTATTSALVAALTIRSGRRGGTLRRHELSRRACSYSASPRAIALPASAGRRASVIRRQNTVASSYADGQSAWGGGHVGALGSRRTTAERAERLAAAGVTAAELARLHAPCGLDIGGRTPEETALSILAEIVAVRAGRSSAPLRETAGSIQPRQQ